MEDFMPVLKCARLFEGLTEEEIRNALECVRAKTRYYRKEEYIFRAGDSTDSLGVVLSGRAMIVQEDHWGSRHILSAAEPGQCFAETFAAVPGSVLNVSAVTERNSLILFMDVNRILTTCERHCAHHVRMGRNLLTDLAEKNLAFSEKLVHLSQRSTRAKLLSYLSAQAQKQGSSSFVIPFSRQQLADYLLVERSGLSAELGKMRDEGLIGFDKNSFTLK